MPELAKYRALQQDALRFDNPAAGLHGNVQGMDVQPPGPAGVQGATGAVGTIAADGTALVPIPTEKPINTGFWNPIVQPNPQPGVLPGSDPRLAATQEYQPGQLNPPPGDPERTGLVPLPIESRQAAGVGMPFVPPPEPAPQQPGATWNQSQRIFNTAQQAASAPQSMPTINDSAGGLVLRHGQKAYGPATPTTGGTQWGGYEAPSLSATEQYQPGQLNSVPTPPPVQSGPFGPGEPPATQGRSFGTPMSSVELKAKNDMELASAQEKLKYLAGQGVLPWGMGKATAGAAGSGGLKAWGDPEAEAKRRKLGLEGDVLQQGLDERKTGGAPLSQDKQAEIALRAGAVDMPDPEGAYGASGSEWKGRIASNADNVVSSLEAIPAGPQRERFALVLMNKPEYQKWVTMSRLGIPAGWTGLRGVMSSNEDHNYAKATAGRLVAALQKAAVHMAPTTPPATPQGGAAPGHPVMG
jgi:hypothetical protein